MNPPRFPFLRVAAATGRLDELGYVLMELGAQGVQLTDDAVVASFGNDDEALAARAALLNEEPDLVVEHGAVIGDEWLDAYKEHFKPFALTRSIVVVPSWENYSPKSGERVLHMDPGRAFGTGLHATTALVAAALEEHLKPGASVLDVGTGSGILVLVAMLLGASSGTAVDNDVDVLEVARENAARNGFAPTIDARDVSDVAGTFDLVVANIRASVLIAMRAALRARCGGLLVLSGVLAGEEDEVREAFVADGMIHLATTRRGDGDDAWVALTMRPG